MQDFQISHAITNHLKTGNIFIDVIAAAAVVSMIPAVIALAKNIAVYISDAVRRYTNKFCIEYNYEWTIRYDNISTSNSSGNSGSLEINGDNDVLVNGITKLVTDHVMTKAAASQDVVLMRGADLSTTRYMLKNAHIVNIPDAPITIDDIQITIVRDAKFNTGDKNTTTTESTTIILRSNYPDRVHKFMDQCKNKEIERVYPASLDDDETQYYWSLDNRRNNSSENEDRYVCSRIQWISQKTFRSLFFPQKTELMMMLDYFKTKNGPWSTRYERVHSFNMIMYGRSGGGKTSTAKAIANYTGRHIYKIKLTSIRNDQDLLNIMLCPEMCYTNRVSIPYTKYCELPLDKRIYLFDDMDCDGDIKNIIADRDNKSDAEKTDVDARRGPVSSKHNNDSYMELLTKKSDVTLNGLLQALDGIVELSGAIIIICTNRIDKFDKELIRPGRMTMAIKFDYMKVEHIFEYLKYYYSIDTLPDVGDLENLEPRTPAQIEGICQTSPTVVEAISKIFNH